MDQPVKYPTWDHVGMPKRIVDAIKALRSGPVLDYLVLNRVFRFHVKAQYTYTCSHCGNAKKLYRPYEDYSSCDNCGSNLISCSSMWRMGKDKIEEYSSKETLMAKVIQQMPIVYLQYFRQYPPDNFLTCQWIVDRKAVEIGRRKAIQPEAPDIEDGDDSTKAALAPTYSTAFCCGEKIIGVNQAESICKAAVLCPFLWDDCFDWKIGLPRDRGRETHILPMFNLWARLLTESGKKSGEPRSSRIAQVPPLPAMPAPMYANPVGNQAVEQSLPAAIVEALQDEPAGVFHEIFGVGGDH